MLEEVDVADEGLEYEVPGVLNLSSTGVVGDGWRFETPTCTGWL